MDINISLYKNKMKANKSMQNMDSENQDSEQIFNPYNPANNEITLNEIQSILKTYGVHYNIDNINLYQRSFIHKSYTKRPVLENEAAEIKIASQPENCLPLLLEPGIIFKIEEGEYHRLIKGIDNLQIRITKLL